MNPVRVVGAAARVARKYGEYRRQKAKPQKSSSTVKRKITKINIDTEYERARGPAEEDNDDNDSNHRVKQPDTYDSSEDQDDD